MKTNARKIHFQLISDMIKKLLTAANRSRSRLIYRGKASIQAHLRLHDSHKNYDSFLNLFYLKGFLILTICTRFNFIIFTLYMFL